MKLFEKLATRPVYSIEIDIPIGYTHEHPKLVLKKGKPDKIIINLQEWKQLVTSKNYEN